MRPEIKKLLLLNEAEDDRILKLSDAEVMAEFLELYGGNRKLAKKSIDMLRARVQAQLGRSWKQ